MPNLLFYVRGEWTTIDGSAAEIGSLYTPVTVSFTNPIIDKPITIATATATQVYDSTVDPSDWDWAFVWAAAATRVLVRGTADTDSSVFEVHAGSTSPLISNQTCDYNATLATRLADTPVAITEVWVYQSSGSSAGVRFVAGT